MLKLNQRGFTAFETIVVLLLLGILGIAIYLAYLNTPVARKPYSTPAASKYKSICDFNNNEVGCGLNSFKVLAPSGNEKICIGKNYDIKWAAPDDVSTVTITLREDGLSGQEYKLGIFPASQKHFVWGVTGIPAGSVYKIWINTVYKSSSVNNVSSGLLTIQGCS